ncbi:MAG: type II secretion system protein N [Gammaproteobacteria bacterium]|nr:type II secretion system protein N [Gammaproteobacteria bacterium]
MSRRNLLIAVGVAGFLVFAVALVPARIIGAVLPAGPITISDTSGTLWSGTARSVRVAGFELQDVSWDVHVLSLLIGRLSLSIDGKWGAGFVRGDIATGIGGALRVRDLRVAGPLAPVLRLMNMRGSGGELSIDIAELDIEDQWPTRVVGTVGVGRLPFSMLGIPGGSMGNYGLEFDIPEVAEDGVIPGTLMDKGGPLEVVGELRLTPPQDYGIQARLKARPDAPPELTQGLMLAGPKLPDGSHEFEMTGSL